MERRLIKYCYTCKELRPADDHHCTRCGAKLKTPHEDDDLRLEIAAKILDSIKINGDENDVIIRKLKRLSLAPTSEDIQMKFCLKCGVEKPWHDNYCASGNCMGTKLIVPRTSKERVDAMRVLFQDVPLPTTPHYELLCSVWSAITPTG